MESHHSSGKCARKRPQQPQRRSGR
jgi:hypothetical protein